MITLGDKIPYLVRTEFEAHFSRKQSKTKLSADLSLMEWTSVQMWFTGHNGILIKRASEFPEMLMLSQQSKLIVSSPPATSMYMIRDRIPEANISSVFMRLSCHISGPFKRSFLKAEDKLIYTLCQSWTRPPRVLYDISSPHPFVPSFLKTEYEVARQQQQDIGSYTVCAFSPFQSSSKQKLVKFIYLRRRT